MKVLLLAVLSLVLFFNGLGDIALWDPDEPRQAIVAREMIERNDYIHTYLNGEPNFWKPPFYSWMIVLTSKLTGSLSEFSSRMPSAIAASLLVFVTFLFGRYMADSKTGFYSAMVLMTNYQFLSNAREAVMDMTFAFFIGLTILLSYRAIQRDNAWRLVISFVPSSLAILTKGPAGLVIPGCIVLIFLLITKKTKRFGSYLVYGGFLSLAIASIWFLLAGREYFDEIILNQSFTRYVNAFDHRENVLYYFNKLFVNFLPWSILLPISIYHALKNKYWLPLAWFLFTFLFFEVSTSKRAIYLLSLYPASALLCGFYIRDKWSWIVERSGANTFLKTFAFLLVCLPLGGFCALLTIRDDAIAVFRNNPAIHIYLAGICMTGVMFLYVLFKKRERQALFILFTYLVVTGFGYTSQYLPVVDKVYKSPRLITDLVQDYAKVGDVFLYGENSSGLIFYLGKPTKILLNQEDLKRHGKIDSLLIVAEKNKKNVASCINVFYRPIGRALYEKEAYVLYVGKDGI